MHAGEPGAAGTGLPITLLQYVNPLGVAIMAFFLKKIGGIGLTVPWIIRATACLAYVLFLTCILLAPSQDVEKYCPHFPYADKALHFFSFGGVVVLARFAFRDPRHLNVPGWLVPVLALAYGAAIEIAQGLVVQYQRSFEWADIAANGLGVASFWFLSVFLLADEESSLR